MRAPRIALVVFILVRIGMAVGLMSLLLLGINVSVGLYHSYIHVMVLGRSVNLRRNLDVMGVRKDNVVPGIVTAIQTANDHNNHQCIIASKGMKCLILPLSN